MERPANGPFLREFFVLPPGSIISGEEARFAQFLEARAAQVRADGETVTEADARWDELLSSPESQQLL